jgi:hypothetical protein
MYYEKRRKIFNFLGIVAVIVFAVSGLLFYYSGFKVAQKTLEEEKQKQEAVEKAKSKENVFVNDVSSMMQKEQEQTKLVPIYIPKSENFQMREVVIGGYETSMGGEMKDSPLKVYDVRSEVLSSKDGKNVKLYISWKTNKLAISEVHYSKAGGVPNVLSEEGPGFSHALIIGKFDFSTRYTYSVKAKDRWGNQVESDEFIAYSGQKTDSVFMLITKEFKKLFNWTGM